jgi:hypothetical protein
MPHYAALDVSLETTCICATPFIIRGAAPAARPRLQPRQLPAHLGATGGGRALVTHNAA